MKKIVYLQAFESITYHALLAANFSGLYFYMPKSLYGTMGILFSIIYGATSWINAGLDDTLPSFFKEIHSYIKDNKGSVFLVFLPNIILYSIFVTIFFWIQPYNLSPLIYTIASLTVATESLKKTCKVFLQLSLKLHITVFGELWMMGTYTFFVWLGMIIFPSITLYHIFVPLLAFSFVELMAFVYIIKKNIDQRLVYQENTVKKKSVNQFVRTRLLLFIYTIGSTLTSTNTVIPIISIWYGLLQAAESKWITSLVMNTLFIIKRIVDTVSMILFSQDSSNKKQLHHTHTLTYIPIMILCVSAIFYIWHQQTELTDHFIVTSLCILIPSLDVACIAYKRWLMQQRTILTLLAPYCGLAIYLALVFYIYPETLSGMHILISIGVSRLISAVFMVFHVHYLLINSPVPTR